jgi:hypothetical protein
MPPTTPLAVNSRKACPTRIFDSNMKRAPTWLALSGVGVVLAALCLCDWIMGWWTKLPDHSASEPTPAPAQPTAAAAPPPPVSPPAERRPKHNAGAPLPAFTAPPTHVPAPPVFANAPAFVAPPGAIPAFILEVAERTTQLVRGFTRGAWIVFGFYPDGSIRFVDLDGGTYEGNSSSARAAMSEVGGTRSFALAIGVAIGVAGDGRLQASFSGGIHDGQTIVLETITEKPVA